MKDNTAKYIERYAQPDTAVPCPLDPNAASVAVLIPVYDEPLNWLERLDTLLAYPDILVCVVVNHAESALPEVKSCNRAMLSSLCAKYDPLRDEINRGIRVDHGVSIGHVGAGWLCVIDRCSEKRELPDRRSGVGVARKLAADLLLRWSGAVRCPWIVSTDADASVPHVLLKALETHASRASAITLPFRHIPSGDIEVDEATTLYEIHLRLYRAGLEAAGSTYAFDSLGSALAVHRDAYATARGFPQREGGEDFYLLNKLAKLGGIQRFSGEPIRVLSRHSQRAPFGTGPAVADIIANGHASYRTYDPRHFLVLQLLLDAARIGVTSETTLTELFRELASTSALDSHIALTAADLIGKTGLANRLADAVLRTTSDDAALRRFHDYFDGLRTLQWIHGMQQVLPDIPWRKALPERLSNQDLTIAEYCDLLFESAHNGSSSKLFGTGHIT